MGLFKRKRKYNAISLSSPLDGEIVPLEQVPDETFSAKILGNGVAVIPNAGVLVASDRGEVLSVSDTNHAVVVRYDSGVEVLMHIGIDTVELGGECYNSLVTAGHTVNKGDVLIKFDTEKIKAKGYDIITPIIITNSEEFRSIFHTRGNIEIGKELIILEK